MKAYIPRSRIDIAGDEIMAWFGLVSKLGLGGGEESRPEIVLATVISRRSCSFSSAR